MPIQFSCPHCGKQTVVADQFAGQSGPCAACGATVTIPLPGLSGPMASRGNGSTLFVILAIVGIGFLACAGLGALLLLPAVQVTRASARQSMSRGHLTQIVIALHSYHDTHGTFPPAVVKDADGNPLYSGRVLLLPYLEQAALYERFDKSKAWDSPENINLSRTSIETFLDPANTRPEKYRSDYVFVTGTRTVFDGGQSTRIADITDGTSNTLIVIETSSGPSSWAAPQEWNADTGQLPPSNYPGTVLAAFADGSSRRLDPKVILPYLRQLTVRNDGEVVPAF